MRKIDKPSYDSDHVFEICVNSIADQHLKSRFQAISSTVSLAAKDYDLKATNFELFSIAAHHGNNEDLIAGDISKEELKNLYSAHLVPQNKPARAIYEYLLSRSAGKLCPLCGFGHVKTLDHYLPKAKFPIYSVLPNNLVPSCRDCNTEKLASIATTAGAQSIHPYYDPNHFFSDQWIFARVEQTIPPTIIFYVVPPSNWDAVSKERVTSHFKDFQLADRFSVQVATELAAFSSYLSGLSDENSRQQHLIERANSYYATYKNSWQTALVQALASSEWYWKTGFNAS